MKFLLSIVVFFFVIVVISALVSAIDKYPVVILIVAITILIRTIIRKEIWKESNLHDFGSGLGRMKA